MIKNEAIICMPLTTWESDFPNTLVQLMQILSKENTILFVDYEYTIKDILKGVQGNRPVPVQRILGLESRLRKLKTKSDGEIHILTPPPVLPINWVRWKNPYRILLQLNSRFIRTSIWDALQQLDMEHPIVVNGYNPFFGLPLAGAFDETLNIYFCYDEITGDPFYSFHGPEIEKDYIRKADGVIVTSEGLMEAKCPFHSNCYVVKNGVDFNLFNSVSSYRKPESNRKTIGYTGSIDDRFDIVLVRNLVQMMPEFQFLFVGRIPGEQVEKELSKFPNVLFTGGRRPEEVPFYLKEVDVAIIPYLKNELTRGVYPLKINEYLAAGKPVVMTDFAKIDEVKDLVRVAETREQFFDMVLEELYNDNDIKRKERMAFAEKNSWEQKAEEFSEAVEKMRIKKFVMK